MVVTAGKFKLYRLGSDPEFVFAKDIDWTPVLVPAAEIMKVDKGISLKSFIGMDSHTLNQSGTIQTTAELRPLPTYNINMHLIYLAHGVNEVAKFLASKKMYAGVVPLALPILDKECLGGHIHVSGFWDEPDTKFMVDHLNATWVGNNIVKWNQEEPFCGAQNYGQEIKQAKWVEKAIACEVTTPQLFERVMNHLILPFEYWIQPWAEREKRMQAYAGAEGGHYFIRWIDSKRPHKPHPKLYKEGISWSSKYDSWAYMHFEYRSPSTWLIHPWLAYAYFALAKLTCLNYEKVLKVALNTEPFTVSSQGGNADAQHEFVKRLGKLMQQGLTMSKDIEAVHKAIKICGDSREAWFANKSAGIDVAAWQELLKTV